MNTNDFQKVDYAHSLHFGSILEIISSTLFFLFTLFIWSGHSTTSIQITGSSTKKDVHVFSTGSWKSLQKTYVESNGYKIPADLARPAV
jgi:hypothetical protein